MYARSSKSILLGIAGLITSSFLSGCVMETMVTDSARSLNREESSILLIDRKVRTGVASEFYRVSEPYTNTVVVQGSTMHEYNRIKLVPGYYIVTLKSFATGYVPSFPRVRIHALPGKTYLFASSFVMNRKAVDAQYKEVSTTDYAEHERSGAGL